MIWNRAKRRSRRGPYNKFSMFPIYTLIIFVLMPNNGQVRLNYEEQPFPDCETCRMTRINRRFVSNSTPRDAILIPAEWRIVSIFPFIRTLRTTGCRARVILFLDNKARTRYPLTYYQRLEDCGVEFVNITIKEDLIFARFKLFADYLTEHRNEFDRVMQIDLFDTTVQYDPFTTEWDNNSFYLQAEKQLNKDFDYCMRWLEDSYKRHDEFKSRFHKRTVNVTDFGKERIINGGGQFGNVDAMIEFDKLLQFSSESLNDQGLMNYLYYSGILNEKIHHNIVLLPYNNDIMMSIIGSIRDRTINIPNGTLLGGVTFDDKTPALIHQFDREYDLYRMILDACPNSDPPTEDYLRRQYRDTPGAV